MMFNCNISPFQSVRCCDAEFEYGEGGYCQYIVHPCVPLVGAVGSGLRGTLQVRLREAIVSCYLP